MESAIIVEGFLFFEKEYGLLISRFIGDGDSSVHKRLLEKFPTKKITKIECRNHLLRNFGTKLLAISKDTKFDIQCRKILGSETQRITKDIRCAIKYRKKENVSRANQILNLQADIKNTPFHIFGDHSNCSSYFCSTKSSINMIPKMKDSKILAEIQQHLKRLIYNADSLIEDVDSNIVEQFNSVIAKYVGGKRINYSNGQNYSDRCYLAAIQFNTGNYLFIQKIIVLVS